MSKRPEYDGPCPVERVLAVFGGKWKPSIIFHLEQTGSLRFNALRKTIPKISTRMLTQNLRQLERDGIVNRTQFAEMPMRVEYSLTALGMTIGPLGQILEQWGQNHMAEIIQSRALYDKTLPSSKKSPER